MSYGYHVMYESIDHMRADVRKHGLKNANCYYQENEPATDWYWYGSSDKNCCMFTCQRHIPGIPQTSLGGARHRLFALSIIINKLRVLGRVR